MLTRDKNVVGRVTREVTDPRVYDARHDRDATTDHVIDTHRLGDTPGEGGAKGRVRDVQGYTEALGLWCGMIMV